MLLELHLFDERGSFFWRQDFEKRAARNLAIENRLHRTGGRPVGLLDLLRFLPNGD